MRTRLCAPVALLGLLLLGTPSLANPKDPTRDNVIEAVRTGYVHGVTAEIAHARVGVAGVDELLSLLADPDFDARDNVVAFLHHLGDDSSVEALLQQLQQPVGDQFQPANDRALLLIPQTLGGIAGRGSPRALAALLDMTDETPEDAMRSPARHTLSPDLIAMALRGLAYAQDSVALERLVALQNRGVGPKSGRSISPIGDAPADMALELYDELAAGPVTRAPEGGEMPQASSSDPETHITEHNLKFANHRALSNPMTYSRADQLVAHATTKLSTSTFAGDMACCIRTIRKSAKGWFGESGDGLDIIDNANELESVWDASPKRFKVVRMINYCNGPAQNAYGCGQIEGNDIAVVRRANLHQEAMLWAHEFGHNLGLEHDDWDPRSLMFPGISTDPDLNLGLSAQECSVFHSQGASAEECSGVGCF